MRLLIYMCPGEMGHGDMGNGEMGNGHVDPHPIVWLIWSMVCLLASCTVSVSVGNGWPHNALRHHWLIPISCHSRDCKALLVTSLTRVVSRPLFLPLTFNADGNTGSLTIWSDPKFWDVVVAKGCPIHETMHDWISPLKIFVYNRTFSRSSTAARVA